MSNIPSVNRAYAEEAPQTGFMGNDVAGAWWQWWPRDNYPVASDEIRNHDKPTFLGYYDGTESVADWNPWEGTTFPRHAIRHGYGTPGLQEFPQAAPLAIDAFDRNPDHGQVRPSGIGSPAALIPFLDLPDHGQHLDPSSLAGYGNLGGTLPYHYDTGLQIDQGQAIGPRQVFRQPPSYSDQTAAFYAAGF